MFTFLGNFRCIIFNSYSSVIVFLDTRRKPKLFQTGWRVLNTDLQEHPSQGGCAGRAQSPGMHIWVGMGTGGHGCVGDTGLGTNGGEGVPPGLPTPAALGSLRDGISSAASPTTLRTQTSAFSTAYDGAKPKRF